jgi:hypothetical protein
VAVVELEGLGVKLLGLVVFMDGLMELRQLIPAGCRTFGEEKRPRRTFRGQRSRQAGHAYCEAIRVVRGGATRKGEQRHDVGRSARTIWCSAGHCNRTTASRVRRIQCSTRSRGMIFREASEWCVGATRKGEQRHDEGRSAQLTRDSVAGPL